MRKLITIVLIQFCSLLSFAQFTDTQCDEQGIEYTANNDGTTCTVTGYIDDCHADIVIPEVYEGLTVSSIGECAFDECERLTSIVIPNSVSSIGEAAFVCCTALTSVTIPSSVTSIGRFAFEGCVNLSSIVVHEDNPIYDSRDNCNAIIETTSNTLIVGCKTTIIPNTLTIIGENAFTYCEGLTSINIPNSVTDISYGAFVDCINLSSVVIGTSVTSIGEFAFNGCSGLTSITIPNSVTSIGNFAFEGCINLSSIDVDEDNSVYDSRNNCNAIIRSRDNRLVVGCKTTIIPNSVTSIGGHAFSYCSSLTSITIPNSVTTIGNWAFDGCSGLTSVTVEWETPLEINNSVFSSVDLSNLTLIVPKGTKAAYEAADVWRDFGTIVEMGSGDLSGDGTVNGTDLVVQTNLILSGEYNPVADLNNDAKVNGTDYVLMVNVILDIASARTMTATTANRDAELSIEDFSIRAGETKEMLVSLKNPDTDLTLLQFDLRLPAGLSIAKEGDDEGVDIAGRTTWKKHSLRSNAVGDVTRILLASNANAVFSGDEGRVVSIRLTADDGFSDGDICLENQLLVAPDAWETAPARYVYTVGGTTSVGSVKAGQSADVYTLTGSKIRRQATSFDGLPKGVYVVKGRKVVVR